MEVYSLLPVPTGEVGRDTTYWFAISLPGESDHMKTRFSFFRGRRRNQAARCSEPLRHQLHHGPTPKSDVIKKII